MRGVSVLLVALLLGGIPTLAAAQGGLSGALNRMETDRALRQSEMAQQAEPVTCTGVGTTPYCPDRPR
jgi:hypothetical protein